PVQDVSAARRPRRCANVRRRAACSRLDPVRVDPGPRRPARRRASPHWPRHRSWVRAGRRRRRPGTCASTVWECDMTPGGRPGGSLKMSRSARAFRNAPTETNTFYPRLLGTRGAVACEHHLAADAAADVLKAGGNAVDAMVAGVLVEGVVNPQMHTVGGECP